MIGGNLGLPFGYESNSTDTKYGGINNKVRKFDIKLDTSMFSHSLNSNKKIDIFNKHDIEGKKSINNKTKRNRKK